MITTTLLKQKITANLIIDHRAEDEPCIGSFPCGGVAPSHLDIATQQETDDVGIQ